MKIPTFPGLKTYLACALLAAFAIIEPALTDGSLWENWQAVLGAAAGAALRAAVAKLAGDLRQVADHLTAPPKAGKR